MTVRSAAARVQAALDAAARAAAGPLGADGPARLRERMEILEIAPDGPVSAGGTCRLLPAADGRWVALNLSRRDDVDLLAAWMGHEWDGPVWDAVAGGLRAMDAAGAVDRAQLLGIPAAVAVAPEEYEGQSGVSVCRRAPRPRDGTRHGIVDLSSLWAGPLCARVLGDALGVAVTKIESAHRPDGARRGAPTFWDRLNAGKEEVTLDFTTEAGRRELRERLDGAAVVVERVAPTRVRAPRHRTRRRSSATARSGSRSRATARSAPTATASRSVTTPPSRAGSPSRLVARRQPVFVGDAVADPLSGLVAAHTAAQLVGSGTAAFVDVCMAGVVNAALRGPELR